MYVIPALLLFDQLQTKFDASNMKNVGEVIN